MFRDDVEKSRAPDNLTRRLLDGGKGQCGPTSLLTQSGFYAISDFLRCQIPFAPGLAESSYVLER